LIALWHLVHLISFMYEVLSYGEGLTTLWKAAILISPLYIMNHGMFNLFAKFKIKLQGQGYGRNKLGSGILELSPIIIVTFIKITVMCCAIV